MPGVLHGAVARSNTALARSRRDTRAGAATRSMAARRIRRSTSRGARSRADSAEVFRREFFDRVVDHRADEPGPWDSRRRTRADDAPRCGPTAGFTPRSSRRRWPIGVVPGYWPLPFLERALLTLLRDHAARGRSPSSARRLRRAVARPPRTTLLQSSSRCAPRLRARPPAHEVFAASRRRAQRGGSAGRRSGLEFLHQRQHARRPRACPSRRPGGRDRRMSGAARVSPAVKGRARGRRLGVKAPVLRRDDVRRRRSRLPRVRRATR